MTYKHILLVTDLKDDADIVAKKAKSLRSTQSDAKFSVLHIVENSMVGVGYEYMSAGVFHEIDIEHAKQAQTTMKDFLSRNELSPEHVDVAVAISSSNSIVEYCDEHDVDVLVVGRHERHGLSAFINGSTADNIVSKIHCDVLVVHLDAPK